MHTEFINIFNIFVIFVCLCSVAYLLLAIFAVELFNWNRKRKLPTTKIDFPVTILKPVYGLDPEMLDNLRSFCKQDYPTYQIIFGVKDKKDLAIPLIQKVIKEFKKVDISYVVNPKIHGANLKVSNLINIYPEVKHDYVLIADSDMRVPENYLSSIMPAFADNEVGAVTCLYSGTAKGKIASTLNAMFINEWFLPSVLISKILQPIKYCLGATMVVRRELLEKVGGFKTLSNYLADDYMLGKLVSDLGYKIHLSDFIVENIVEEKSLKDLVTHELRWARTLRRVEPLGYAFTFLTDTLIVSSLMSLFLYLTSNLLLWSLTPLIFVLFARIVLHYRILKITGSTKAGNILLIPFRDILSFCIRVISFTGNSIQWRNNSFNVDQAGLIHTDNNDKDQENEIPGLATTQDI